MPTLVLLRHGESTWNASNRFTGWVDVDLSAAGEDEARRAGELLAAESGLTIDVCHTSVLTRATRTANIALEVAGRTFVPVRRHWRLNERHYGALQGLNKRETAELHGADQVKAWRRSYATPPPPLDALDPGHPRNDPRYRGVPPAALPATESLKDVVRRLTPYFEDAIAADLYAGLTVLVVAHGNSLRALAKYLEDIPDEAIIEFEIPTGVPRRYELARDLSVLEVGYLGAGPAGGRDDPAGAAVHRAAAGS